MEFAIAAQAHLERMCEITRQAKRQLAALGIDQWQKGYPSREIWQGDIREQGAYVVLDDGTVVGCFAFQTRPDSSYRQIDGSWLTGAHSPYASMHRVCVAGGCKGKGVAGRMFSFGIARARDLGLPSVRIDTHPGNTPMRRALEKAGFAPCGTIILASGCEQGDLRIAYEILSER